MIKWDKIRLIKKWCWWHHFVKMLITDNDVVSIFALSRLLEIDTTLILHKIKALLSDPGNKALFVIDKPHEPWGCTNIKKIFDWTKGSCKGFSAGGGLGSPISTNSIVHMSKSISFFYFNYQIENVSITIKVFLYKRHSNIPMQGLLICVFVINF